MTTLRDKIHAVLWGYTGNDEQHQDSTRAIMHIIENHIEWSDPDDCPYKHIYGGDYEITNGYELYNCWGEEISQHDSYETAMAAAQAHKEGRG